MNLSINECICQITQSPNEFSFGSQETIFKKKKKKFIFLSVYFTKNYKFMKNKIIFL